MQTLLMKRTARQEFELLKQLLRNKNGVTNQEIMDSFNISLHNVYRIQKQLADNLSLVFEKNLVILSKKNGYLSIYIDKSLCTSYVIDLMSLYYLKISQQYHLSDALFYGSYTSVEALAQEVNLSLSHTYKILNKMNDSFEPFNLSIEFPAKRNRTNVVGDEKNVRMTMLYIYWTIYKGIHWPFYHAPKNFYELPFPIKSNLLSPSQKMRLSYFQTYTYWQILYRKEFVSLSKEFLDYLTIFEEISPVSFPDSIKEALHKNQVSDDVIQAEEYYFGFLTRFYIANIDSIEDKFLIVNNLIHSGLPLTTFATTLLNDFIAENCLILSEENFVLSYYQLIFNLLYIQFFGINVPFSQIENEKFPFCDPSIDLFDSKKEEFIQFAYEKLSFDLFPMISKSSSLVEYLAKILWFVYNSSSHQKKLKILIQYSKTIYGYDLIKNRLSNFFSKSAITFTYNMEEADIIISDSYEHTKSENEQAIVFYFEYPYDQDEWHKLLKSISQLLY
ncbi:hypothetical protein A5821_002036 [Enterococcus sp. 7F3_DIV0205]|uniref:Mga helix-turn-helix domain-containing protein n=1 Tax=Candidatus Enterococcus palustris TaxID=1834189 RepID=A0AAQ3Y7P2_9ENTE|nr:helix-turn-helix domain-containing protein [Enterococcus sp. 7F3_DIV0205]OTN82475.1 hypothetical protein A5821_002386 [Enterococcus sp. 7F3_DIV0205]